MREKKARRGEQGSAGRSVAAWLRGDSSHGGSHGRPPPALVGQRRTERVGDERDGVSEEKER